MSAEVKGVESGKERKFMIRFVSTEEMDKLLILRALATE